MSTEYHSSMSIEAWADHARSDKAWQSVENQRTINILQTMFEGKIDPDSAGGTIASIYEPLIKRGYRISPVVPLWLMICGVARALGSNRDVVERVVDMLNSISKLPDVTNICGRALGPISGMYWRDLPELAIMFREYVIGRF